MLESTYQSHLIGVLESMFPGCVVLKNDSEYQQGIPDLLVLWRDRWAMLEVKAKTPTRASDFEPNQEWFIEKFASMFFGEFIYPENEEEVLHALQQAFRNRR